MKKSTIILLCVGGALGVLFAAMPTTEMKRHVDIYAPDSIVNAKCNLFKTYFDSDAVRLIKFDLKPQGDSTRLTWTFNLGDQDNGLSKVYWYFKKDGYEKEVMERGLNDIKKVAEESFQELKERK
ncbi:MAG TPA: hypothetical protein DGG95_14620 [Cytophagales bacterium]|jgi:hypothetical protein|nr:hypothetical protein [Cytophagales bacterium]